MGEPECKKFDVFNPQEEYKPGTSMRVKLGENVWIAGDLVEMDDEKVSVSVVTVGGKRTIEKSFTDVKFMSNTWTTYTQNLLEWSTGRKWRCAGAQAEKVELAGILREMQDLVVRTDMWKTVSVLRNFAVQASNRGYPTFKLASDHLESVIEVELLPLEERQVIIARRAKDCAEGIENPEVGSLEELSNETAQAIRVLHQWKIKNKWTKKIPTKYALCRCVRKINPLSKHLDCQKAIDYVKQKGGDNFLRSLSKDNTPTSRRAIRRTSERDGQNMRKHGMKPISLTAEDKNKMMEYTRATIVREIGNMCKVKSHSKGKRTPTMAIKLLTKGDRQVLTDWAKKLRCEPSTRTHPSAGDLAKRIAARINHRLTRRLAACAPSSGSVLNHRNLAGLTPSELDLVEKVRQGRRLTEQELPRSYLHTAEEVLARRRLIHGVQTPPTLAALLKEIEDAE